MFQSDGSVHYVAKLLLFTNPQKCTYLISRKVILLITTKLPVIFNLIMLSQSCQSTYRKAIIHCSLQISARIILIQVSNCPLFLTDISKNCTYRKAIVHCSLQISARIGARDIITDTRKAVITSGLTKAIITATKPKEIQQVYI